MHAIPLLEGRDALRGESECTRDPIELLSDQDDAVKSLPNVHIDAKVYAYCEVVTAAIAADAYVQYDPAVHGRPVYVGQTVQEIRERDKKHLGTNHTTFDRQYTDQSQYIMVLLTERRFAAAEKDEDFANRTLQAAGAWMDY